MKKFTKICRVTAGVLFAVGLVFFLVFGMLDNFTHMSMLENVQAKHNFPIKFHFVDGDHAELDIFNYVMRADTDGEDGYVMDIFDEEEWEEREQENDWEGSREAGDDSEKITYPKDEVKNLKLSMDACYLDIYTADSEDIELIINKNNGEVKYGLDGDTLKLVDKHRNTKVWDFDMKNVPRIKLYLPKDIQLEDADLEMGVSYFSSIPLEAEKITLNAGAGECTIEGFTAEKADVIVGAGSVNIEDLKAEDLTLDVGAGELIVENFQVEDSVDISMGMGNAELNGLLNGDMNLDCGMGSAVINLDGFYTDYNYTISCGMGNVSVGDSNIQSGDQHINNNADYKMDIDCGMGNAEISFTE